MLAGVTALARGVAGASEGELLPGTMAEPAEVAKVGRGDSAGADTPGAAAKNSLAMRAKLSSSGQPAGIASLVSVWIVMVFGNLNIFKNR